MFEDMFCSEMLKKHIFFVILLFATLSNSYLGNYKKDGVQKHEVVSFYWQVLAMLKSEENRSYQSYLHWAGNQTNNVNFSSLLHSERYHNLTNTKSS